jgi:hypothetical protein
MSDKEVVEALNIELEPLCRELHRFNMS